MQEFLNFLSDQRWNGIAAIIAILAFIFGLFALKRKRKVLSYHIDRTRLLTIGSEIKDQVKIFFKDKPVQDVELILIKIYNTGNVPIPSKDYEQPLIFDLGQKAEVLVPEKYDANPKSLYKTVNAYVEGTKVGLEPLLLNPGDSITLKMLVNQVDKEIFADARIEGVKEIKKFDDITPRYQIWMLTGFGLMAIGVLTNVIFEWDFGGFLGMVGLVMMLVVGLLIEQQSKWIKPLKSNKK